MTPAHMKPFQVYLKRDKGYGDYRFSFDIAAGKVTEECLRPKEPETKTYANCSAKVLIETLHNKALHSHHVLDHFTSKPFKRFQGIYGYLDWSRSFVGWTPEDLVTFASYIEDGEFLSSGLDRLTCLIGRALSLDPGHYGARRMEFYRRIQTALSTSIADWDRSEAIEAAKQLIAAVKNRPGEARIARSALVAEAYLAYDRLPAGDPADLQLFQTFLLAARKAGVDWGWVLDYARDNAQSIKVLSADRKERDKAFTAIVQRNLDRPGKPDHIGVLLNRDFQDWLAGSAPKGLKLPENPVDGFMTAAFDSKSSAIHTAFFRYRGVLLLMFAHAVVARGQQAALKERVLARERHFKTWDHCKDAYTLRHLFTALKGIVGMDAEEVCRLVGIHAALRAKDFPESQRTALAALVKQGAKAAPKAPPISTKGFLGARLAQAMAAVKAGRLGDRLDNFSDDSVVPWTDLCDSFWGMNEDESVELARVLEHLKPELLKVFTGAGKRTGKSLSGLVVGDLDLKKGDLSTDDTLIVVGNVSCGTVFTSGPEEALLVTGDLHCRAIRTSSQLCVGGRIEAADYIYGEYNDQSLVVGKGFQTHLFIDNDHGHIVVQGKARHDLYVDVHDDRLATPLKKLRAIIPEEFIAPWGAVHDDPDAVAEEASLPPAKRTWCLDYEKFMAAHAAGKRVFLDR